VTEEQEAAYVQAMATCAMVDAMGMQAANAQRAIRGESMAYTDTDFFGLVEKYGIGHNSVLSLFHATSGTPDCASEKPKLYSGILR